MMGDGDVALSHLFTFISGFPSLETTTTKSTKTTVTMIARALPVAAAMLATAAGIAEER